MTNYDFSTLNSSDLENLVCELLNAEQKDGSSVKYRTFKEGKDQGIDFLYSTDEEKYEHVGQVKHYLKSGYAKMFRTLKDTEVAKVKKLKPSRYILATSVALSAANGRDIQTLFTPYIRNLSDIYGQDDLNRLLSVHQTIEKSNYKLWFSSSSVLEAILNSNLSFRAKSFVENELTADIAKFEITPYFDEAKEKLEKFSIVIITGDPGTGKTALAEMLIYGFIKNGYELSFVIDDVFDAERQLRPDDSKQVIYFDDFLGSNEEERKKALSVEARLLRLITQVKKLENKVLILTARSNLIAKVISESEKLQMRRQMLEESTMRLERYTEKVKEKIFHNHLDVSRLPADYEIVLRKIAGHIVRHRNFSPRIIEFITDSYQMKKILIDDYMKFVKTSLDSPIALWEHVYLNQINGYERLVLQTLFTFGNFTSIKQLEVAFNRRIEIENRDRGLQIPSHCFLRATRSLNNGLVSIKGNRVSFINPSIADFVKSYLQNDYSELTFIFKSVLLSDQLNERLLKLNGNKIPEELQGRLVEDYRLFLPKNHRDEDLIRMALFINKHIRITNVEHILYQILDQVNDWESLVKDISLNKYFIDFVNSIDYSSTLHELINKNIGEIINDSIQGLYETDEVLDLLGKFGSSFDLEGLVDSGSVGHIVMLFEGEIDDAVEDMRETILTEGDDFGYISKIKSKIEDFQEYGIFVNPSFKAYNSVDWNEVAWINYMSYQAEKDD